MSLCWSPNPSMWLPGDKLLEACVRSQSCPTLWYHELQLFRLPCPWSSPTKNTGVGCYSLLQGIFPTRGLNLGLLHCRQTLYSLSTREAILEASQVALEIKNLPANAGDIKGVGSIPGSGRSSGGGQRNSFQYSHLENSMDRGAWWVTVHEVTKSRIWLNNWVGVQS